MNHKDKKTINVWLKDETEDIPEDVHIRFTTTDQLKQNGITANIWEERRELHDV